MPTEFSITFDLWVHTAPGTQTNILRFENDGSKDWHSTEKGYRIPAVFLEGSVPNPRLNVIFKVGTNANKYHMTPNTPTGVPLDTLLQVKIEQVTDSPHKFRFSINDTWWKIESTQDAAEEYQNVNVWASEALRYNPADVTLKRLLILPGK